MGKKSEKNTNIVNQSETESTVKPRKQGKKNRDHKGIEDVGKPGILSEGNQQKNEVASNNSNEASEYSSMPKNEVACSAEVPKPKKRKRTSDCNDLEGKTSNLKDKKKKKLKCGTADAGQLAGEDDSCAAENVGKSCDTKSNEQKGTKKRKQKKHEKESQDVESSPSKEVASQSDSSAKYHALEYLRKWKHQRSEWSFQKVRQVWLLKNMYDESKVSEEDFDIMVEYLQDLAGKARQATVDQAEKMVNDAEDNKTVSEEQFDRLRRVLQILS